MADAKIIISAVDQTRAAFDSVKRSIGDVNGLLKGLGVGISAGAYVSTVRQMVDSYTKLTAQLKISTSSANEFGQAFANVQKIASTAQLDIEAVAQTYSRLSNATKDLGISQGQVSNITETIALALKTTGASAEESASAMLQLSQAFGKGKLDGDEFKSVMEAVPQLMRELANSMGVPFGALKDLAKEGRITSDVLVKAFGDENLLNKLREQAKEVRTISGAYTELKNQFVLFAGETDKAAGSASLYAGALNLVASAMERIRKNNGINIALPNLLPGGQALSVMQQIIDFQSKSKGGPSSSGTIKIDSPPPDAVLGFDELTKGMRLVSVELAKIKAQEDSVRKSFEAGKITSQQYKEIMASLAAEKARLTKATSGVKTSIDTEAEAAARFIESLQREVETLGMSSSQLLQYEAAHRKLTPAQQAVFADILRKKEAFDAEQQSIKLSTEAYEAHAQAIADFHERELAAIEENASSEESYKQSLDDYIASLERAIDPTIELYDNIGKIQSALNLGLISPEKADELISFLVEAKDKSKEAADGLENAAKDLGLTFSSAFEDAITGGKQLSEVLKALEQDIVRIITRRLVTEPLSDWITAQIKGFDFGSIFGDIKGIFGFADGGIMTSAGPLPLHAYASGGIASRPQLALFGEGSRPEAFVPLPDGRNIPVKMEGGSGSVVVNMTVNTPDADSFRRSQAQIMAQMQRELNRGRRVA